ncbi:MAG: sulfite exporter TauE/SafE family protein [Flavobacteriales bacterium]|jgi:uncharacterized protein|nr:sulfite exporter TauE/SafE family protein [Flavobacteriales bacterium]
MELSTLFILLTIGVLAGIASGFVGIGGGLIIVPALIYFLDLDQHTAQGTSLALMLPPIGIMAAMQYHSEEHVEWTYSAIIAVTFVLGAWLGSKWSLKLPTSMVRLVFSGILFYAAIGMAVKAFRDIFPGNGT